MSNGIDQIDAYLDGTLSAEERTAFESQMNSDAALREQVDIQKNLRAGIDRLGMKAATASTFRKMTLKNKLYKWGVATVAVTAIATATYFGMNSASPETDSNITYELPATNENGGTEWADADRNLPTQLFTIDPAKDTVIETSGGMVFAIPAGAFVDAKDPVTLEIREALTPMDIMKAGLSTTSNGELLQTGGMFYLNARNGETSLKINPAKPVYANVPTNEIRPGMQLFDGERTANGGINWVNPKPMEKSLVPVDIFSLHFYPEGFVEKVAELGFDANNRKETDSIYYSYSGRQNDVYDENWLDEAQSPLVGFDANDSARARHILISYQGAAFADPVNTRTKAQALVLANDIKSRIDNGSMKMIDVVETYTDDPGSKSGNKGDYGWVTPMSGFVQPFLLTAFNYPVGSVTIFETDFGYHIMEVLEHRFHGDDITPSATALEIDPARIAAIQSEEFQNTLIATKEFEERLQVIFKLGRPEILDLYVNNLDKKMYEIDSMVMGTQEGNQFREFYGRRDGGVAIEQSHMKKLQAYYVKKQEAVRIASEKTYNARTAEQRKQDSIYISAQTQREFDKIDEYGQSLRKEYAINLREAYEQLGISPAAKVEYPGGGGSSYGLEVETTGWKNIDAFVMQATVTRTTVDFTDPVSGKNAVIRYEPLQINIPDAAIYSQLMVYLVTDSLPCFMRVYEANGGYSENLNALLDYSLVVIAEKDGTWFSATTPNVTPGAVNVTLTSTDEATLRNSLDQQYSARLGNDFGSEITYMKETHRFNVRKEKEKAQQRIDAEIMRVIFPFFVEVLMPAGEPPLLYGM